MKAKAKRFAKFTDNELEYIYAYLPYQDTKTEYAHLYLRIESKLRKQIKKYRDFDERFTKKRA